jgi:hypothetical protein
MKQFKKDLPIYLNSFVVTMLLLNTNMNIEDFIWYGLAAISFLWYGSNKTQN